MTSLLQGLIYGVVALNYVSAIDFRGYKLYDPEKVAAERVRVKVLGADYEDADKEYQVTLPADSGKPKAFKIDGLFDFAPVRVVGKHTQGTAHGVHLFYAVVDRKRGVDTTYDTPEGNAKGTPIKCEREDLVNTKNSTRCIAIASGWMIPNKPTYLYIFQHVVHSEMQAFRSDSYKYIFYILRETGNGAPTIKFDEDAKVKVWYNFGVKLGNGPQTLSSLASNATQYGNKFALIGEYEIIPTSEENKKEAKKMGHFDEFLFLKRADNADESKCLNEYVTLGTERITFGELTDPIIFPRTMDELWQSGNEACFHSLSTPSTIKRLTEASEAPDFSMNTDEIIKYEVKAAPHETFYGVVLMYKKEFDDAKHDHYFAKVNDMVFHLKDLRYAVEIVYQLDTSMDVVQYFRNTPAIGITMVNFDYAFKSLPYWMDQCMPHMENEPLHNFYKAISHGGPKFERDNIWPDMIVTKTQCVNTSLLNVSHASFVELVEHHTELRLINFTQQTVERNMSQTYEEYEDFHVDQRNPCNDINVLSQIKRTTKNVSKKDSIVLEAKDDEPIRIKLNLEEGETFLVRFFNVERDESKCQDLDTVAIFLKDDMLVNQKAYIRTLTYEALIKRNKTWTITGKLTIAIPNGCFRIEVVSVFSIQRAKYMHNIRACVIVMALTIIWSGTAILLCYKFSLAGRAYRRLRHMYKRAKRHDNFVRHCLEWKENMEEIIAAWEKIPDDN